MQLIILLLLHTRRIPEKNKSKRRASTYFQCTNIQKNALVYFTRQCWFSMIQCILCHIAILDGAKGGEDRADVLLSEVSVDACQIQPVETGESMRLLPRIKILVKTWMVKKCFPLCRDLSTSLSVGAVSGNISPKGTLVYPKWDEGSLKIDWRSMYR